MGREGEAAEEEARRQELEVDKNKDKCKKKGHLQMKRQNEPKSSVFCVCRSTPTSRKSSVYTTKQINKSVASGTVAAAEWMWKAMPTDDQPDIEKKMNNKKAHSSGSLCNRMQVINENGTCAQVLGAGRCL